MTDEWDSFKSEAAEGWDKIKNDFSDGWDTLSTDFEEVKLDNAGAVAPQETPMSSDTSMGVDESALKIGDTVQFNRPVRHLDENTEGFWGRDGEINYEANGRRFEKVNVEANVEAEGFEDQGDFEDVQPVRKERTSGRGGKKPSRNNTSMIIAIVIALALVVGIVILITTLAGGCGDATRTPTAEDTTAPIATTATWVLNGDAQVADLINRYYAARMLVDTYSLGEILDPSVTIDEAALANEANVVDEYKDISVYTTKGMQDGEWAAYIGFSIKFKNIATAAPGLEAAYVKTDANGQLRLIPYEALLNDTALNAYVAGLADCDAITELVNNADVAYRKALTSDEALYNFIKQIGGNVDVEDPNATSADATAAPEDTTTAPEQTTAAPEATTAAPETTTAAPETTTAAAIPAGEESLTECDDIMYVNKNDVNLRDKASSEGEVLTTLKVGTKVQVVAKGTNWAKVIRLEDGKTGYCSKQFLQGDPVKTTTN